MAYSVHLKPSAARALRELPKKDQRLVAAKLDVLADDPSPAGVDALKGAKDFYRIRAGDYRMIYQVQDRALVVLVVEIGHRREIYRMLKR